MRIATMIRLYRATEGIDQKALAAEIGIGASVLSRVEKGKSPDAAGALKIMTWLFEDAPEPVTLDLIGYAPQDEKDEG